jgi:hypothetical protein
VRGDDGLRVVPAGHMGERGEYASEVVGRQAVLRLLYGEQGEHRRPESVEVEGGYLPGEGLLADGLCRQHEGNVKQGLLAVAEQREVDHRLPWAGGEFKVLRSRCA